MKRLAFAIAAFGAVLAAQQQQPAGRGGRGTAPFQPTPAELQQVQVKTEKIEAMVKDLKAKHTDPDLLADVEVYGKAGRILLEFPDQFTNQNGVTHSLAVLDAGIERAQQLQSGQSPWTKGAKQIHAYYSEIDGSVQPYDVTLPANYDPTKPTRLYVWLHGRQNNTTEAAFIYCFPEHRRRAGRRSPTMARSRSTCSAASTAPAGTGPARPMFSRPSPRAAALQDRRQARDPARLFDGRRRRLAHRAALS